jgi:hypothetical protein
MNLMNLVRSMGFLAFGWTVLALAVGASGVWSPSLPKANFFLPKPSLQQVVTIRDPAWTGVEQMRLVDQVTGKSVPMGLPAGEVWALLTVSPWRDRNGNLEVVGRWARHGRTVGEESFSGLGRFRLPDATVLSRVSLEIIATGRPCLLPGPAGEILFPSGDGRLYRCNLSENSQGDARPSLLLEERAESAGTGSARPVRWRCEQPGTGLNYLIDPVCSPEPRLREYVFVSLSSQTCRGKKPLQEPHKLWWLKMNERYDEIQAAGPLIGLDSKNRPIESVVERFPTVTVDADGRLSLWYMTRKPEVKPWRLYSARLEVDPETGAPRVLPGEMAPGDFAEGPPLSSADGKLVFAMAPNGELTTIELAKDRARTTQP